MEKNTFTAGVVPGGLTDHSEIKIMFCYIVGKLDYPINHADLLEAFASKGYANYFECADALSDLVAAEHLYQDAEGFYSVKATGKEIADTLSEDLPFTVRERILAAASELARNTRNSKSHKAVITETKNGYSVRCTVNDSAGNELFAVELDAPSQRLAQRIRDNFVAKAEDVMRYCITSLTDEDL